MAETMAETSALPKLANGVKETENFRSGDENGVIVQVPNTSQIKKNYLPVPPHMRPHQRSRSDAITTRPRSMPAPTLLNHTRTQSTTLEAELLAGLRPISNPTPPSRSITYLLPTARHSSADLNRENSKIGMGPREDARKSLMSSTSRDSGVLNTPTPSSRSCRRDSGLAPTTTSRLSANSANAGARSLRRELSMEDEIASIKLRNLYNSGISGTEAHSIIESMRGSGNNELSGYDDRRTSMISRNSQQSIGPTPSTNADKSVKPVSTNSPRTSVATFNTAQETTAQSTGDRGDRGEHEYAGGAEDWEDIDGSDVDRYGFIKPKATNKRASISASSNLKMFGHQRVSTSLFLKSSQPRRRNRANHRHLYRIFHHEQAHDMLTSPLPVAAEKLKAREQKRADKWREMAGNARALRKADGDKTGGGMFFQFMTEDPKLISRTWKGIPDCWRSVAWHSFLTASANKRGNCLSDDELIEAYQELLKQNSADDPQIDLDVPRTISSHIMFRRRYRGGQRLLFRVLHAISLHFPDVGYVQGMASLAATLLCYYDEDTAFIMLVRLFELRGLARLYTAGFGGLMDALNELEQRFLRAGPLSKKLDELCISPTAYGTRWYLTLFNYSIPFGAQLRVWDVFMLLGDPDENSPEDDTGFGGLLDVVHATSSGIISSMSDIILKSDFETAMKALTSWVPIKDEDLFMKVVKTEWKKKRRMISKASKKNQNRPESSLR